jgi:hypothetical protein
VPVVVEGPSSFNEVIQVSNPTLYESGEGVYPDGPEYSIPVEFIAGEDSNSFDASHSVDLLSDSTNTLSYHWSIFVSAANGGQAYGGLTNYDSPVLQIPMFSLPDQPDPSGGSDPYAIFWRVRLVVHHIPYTPNVTPSQETVFWFRFGYADSTFNFNSVPPDEWWDFSQTIEASFGLNP